MITPLLMLFVYIINLLTGIITKLVLCINKYINTDFKDIDIFFVIFIISIIYDIVNDNGRR